jgi:plastocyanin
VTIASARLASLRTGFVVLFTGALATGATAAPVVHTVTIEGFEFRPPVVAVKQGDIVEWRNRDILPHTATAQPAGFDSGEIAAGASYRLTAKAKGRFDYICTLHPTMKGTLNVE